VSARGVCLRLSCGRCTRAVEPWFEATSLTMPEIRVTPLGESES
jgi:hypothetical protein